MKSVLTIAMLAACVSGGVRLSPPLEASADQAPQAAPLRLTIDEAVRRGLETSHRIGEAVARGDAADAAIGGRHAATRPQVAAQAGYTRTNNVDEFGIPSPTGALKLIYPDIPDNYRTRLDLQWPIYTGGRLDALERASRIDATASADDIAVARVDLTLEITRAYWALVNSTEAVRVVQESRARVDAHVRDVRNLLAAGLVPPSDVLAAEAQASRQKMIAIQTRSARAVAEADLARLVGAPVGTPIETSAGLDAGPVTSASRDELIAAAKAQRPERAALVKRIAAAGERGVAANSGTKPTVALGGGVDYGRPNARIFPREEAWKSSWDASINVSWPIFDGGRAKSDMAEATAAAKALQERLAEFDAVVAADVSERLSEAESSRAAIDAAADAVRAATEARRVVGERFHAGVATSTDVLDAQVALLQAELDRTQAIASAHLADARLARALGESPVTSRQLPDTSPQPPAAHQSPATSHQPPK